MTPDRKPEFMKEEYSRLRGGLTELFTRLHGLAVETSATGETVDVAARLIAGINSPFLFVVVGEVKAGKSSFINALLHDQITRVAPDPCTDTIQKIVYSPEQYSRDIAPHVREIGLPNEVLRDIAIVDTPGTNSIIEMHQEITERFIPESDLVIFIFPALNPYAKTSWDFFQYVHQEWHKKIVFILQQADRASQEELEVNTVRVVEYARARHVEHPTVFRASARMAWEDSEKSGMEDIWRYIRETITGGRQYALKLESLLTTGLTVLDSVQAAIEAEGEALARDRAEAEKVARHLTRGRESSLRDVSVLQGRLVAAYSKLSTDATAEFEGGLSLFSLFKNSLQGMVTRKNVFKEWVEEVNRKFADELQRKVDSISREASGHITENVVYVLETLVEEMRGSKNAPPPNLTVSDSARRRLRVIDEVIANLFSLLRHDSLSDRLRPQGLQKIGDGAVLGGVITAIGAIIAATAHAVVFDITGGILTSLGALIAVNTLAFKRRSIITRFREGFESGRERFDEELGEKLTAQVELIYSDLDLAFKPFLSNISEREERIVSLRGRSRELRAALEGQLDGARRLASS